MGRRLESDGKQLMSDEKRGDREQGKARANSEQDWECFQPIPCLKAGSVVRRHIILDR